MIKVDKTSGTAPPKMSRVITTRIGSDSYSEFGKVL